MSYTLAYTGAEIDALLGKIDAIFVAEYGSTIYSEVTAAIAAGNKVIVANAGKVFVYAGTDDNSGYVFTQSGPNAAKPNATYVTLSTGNVWSTNSVDLATLQQFYASLMEDTASGSIASFPDGAENVPVKELTADIEPIQDLHGQASPYPEGGYKNKLPLILAGMKTANTTGTWSGNAYTLNDVTFTVQTDNAGNIIGVTANGTASALTVFVLNADINTLPSGNYILNGCPSGGSTSTYFQQIIKSPSPSLSDTGSGVSFTAGGSYTLYGCRIVVENGASVSNKVFYPMIRLSTEADATFAPYSNICPIYSQAEKNILPITLAGLKANNTNGTWNGNSYIYNGVTFAIRTNDAGAVIGIDCSGTATANTPLNFVIGYTFPAGSYLLTSGRTGSSGYVQIISSSYQAYGSEKEVELSTPTEGAAFIRVNSGTDTTGLSFYPMLRSAANPDPTFVPYRCVARVDKMGVNFWDEEWESGAFSTTTGEPVVNASCIRAKNFCPVKPNTDYMVIKPNGNYGNIYWYDKDKAFISNSIANLSGTTFAVTSPSNAAFFKIVTGRSTDPITVYGNNMGLNYPSTDTQYHAFKDRTYFSLAKNVWDEEWENGRYDLQTGGKIANPVVVRCKNYIPCTPSTTYYFDTHNTGSYVMFYDENKNYLNYGGTGGNGSFTTPNNCEFMTFYMYETYGSTYNNDIAVLTAPPEIWGGELNVTTGELEVTHGDYTFNGSEYMSAWNSGHPVLAFSTRIYNFKQINGKVTLICDRYKAVEDSNNWLVEDGAIHLTNQEGSLRVIVGNTTADTPEQFMADIVGTRLIGELATPQIFHLDPVEVKTWLATNNIWSNTGDISVKYRANTALYIEKKLGE